MTDAKLTKGVYLDWNQRFAQKVYKQRQELDFKNGTNSFVQTEEKAPFEVRESISDTDLAIFALDILSSDPENIEQLGIIKCIVDF